MQTIKTILRNFYYNRYYTILNISGLAIGLSCFAFIILYVNDELSCDKHYEDYRNIYRLESKFSVSDRHQEVSKTAFPLGPAMQREYPGIRSYTRLLPVREVFFRYQDNKYEEEKVFFADSTFFDVFSHRFLFGNADNALREVNSIVLTESLAHRYFGDEDPTGKVISYANLFDCKVTAVIPDVPENTHLKYSALVSYVSYKNLVGEEMFRNLDGNQFFAMRLFTYVRLAENISMEEIADKFHDFYNKYMAELCKRLNATYDLRYTRLDRVHLHAGVEWDEPTGDLKTIYIFILVAVSILLIASVNYMNLATARSSVKVKEVGIRKVLGATKSQLILMHLGESLMLTFLSLIIALALVEIFLPFFNSIAGKNFRSVLNEKPLIILYLMTASVFTGFASGLYPAFFLSSFRPAKVLKGMIHTGKNNGMTRKALIVFQFAVSASIIACLIVMGQQMKFVEKTDLGFTSNNVLVLKSTDTSFRRNIPFFIKKLYKNPFIESVSWSDNVPGKGSFMDVLYVEGNGKMQEQLMTVLQVDYNYLDLMGLRLEQGRNFDIQFGTDESSAVIINRSAANELGWREKAIGKKLTRYSEGYRECKVIGVIDNYNYSSLHTKVEPMAIFLSKDPLDYLNIRINSRQQEQALSFISNAWQEFNPLEPLNLDFLKNTISSQYLKEKNLQKIIGYFAILSIFISLIGLFGLTSFITEKYSKNIGLRKLLGATVHSLVFLLSKDFLKVIAISLLISLPLAWYLMERWLQQFAFRVEFKIYWLLLTALLVLSVSFLTVILQTFRTAIAKPVHAIKYE